MRILFVFLLILSVCLKVDAATNEVQRQDTFTKLTKLPDNEKEVIKKNLPDYTPPKKSQ